MTGVVQVAMVLASCATMFVASGCGDEETNPVGSSAVQTDNPERAFAPLIEFAADEPWRPMNARWFIERSSLWFAEDRGCEDRKIAVGHTMPDQRTEATNWIYPRGLGRSSQSAYYRNPYRTRCEQIDFDLRSYADQLTRPHDPGPRIESVRAGQGFYLDLGDGARTGPAAIRAAPTYVERTDEGDSGVRLTYSILFGMHGRPGAPAGHEGDWQRVDVILRVAGDRYEPRVVQLGGYRREVAWGSVRRVGGTHPVVRAARATHTMHATAPGGSCAECVALRTWKSLAEARKEVWYGFGGAWGELGATSATTGPLGPHGFWPSAADKEREREDGSD